MVYSKLTNQVRISSQSSSRNGSKVDTFLIHHQAGTNDDAVIAAMVSGSKGVSANYTISNEGRITCVVPEELRAWTSGSSYDGGKGAAWDRRAITVEIENQSAGGSWPISTAALTAAARLLQDLRARYKINYVLGHRDLWERYRASYATFCPGPATVARIVSLASSLSAAGSGMTLIEEDKDTKMVYIVQSVKDDLGTKVWPNGLYLVTPNGVVPADATTQNVVNRLNDDAVAGALRLYSSEIKALDDRLRAAVKPVDGAALAKAIAPHLAGVVAPTAQEIAVATRTEFIKSPLK